MLSVLFWRHWLLLAGMNYQQLFISYSFNPQPTTKQSLNHENDHTFLEKTVKKTGRNFILIVAMQFFPSPPTLAKRK
jgi:surfactin synthase thioesterase subunit